MLFLTLYTNYAKPINHFKDVLNGINRDDVCIVGAGGAGLNNFIKNNKDKIVISIFPGITNDFQLEAFITRLSSDIVLLNSKRDEILYKKICEIFKLSHNGFLYGASWFTKEKPDAKYKDSIIFFEQIYVPLDKNDKIVLLNHLINLAKQYPDKKFYIKPRENFSNQISLFDISKTLTLPNNLNFTYDNTSLLISSANIVLSISSSVTIEALLSGKKTFCINFGYKNSQFDTFKNSGLIVKFNEFSLEIMPKVDEKWMMENVINPYKNANALKKIVQTYKKQMRKIEINNLIYVKLFINFPLYFLKNPKNSYKKIKKAIDLIIYKKGVENE